MKNAWDTSKNIYNGMKELGVDSIFVGHEHCNSASVVYEGIRFQYGQKSSEYDRYNSVGDDGKIGETALWKKRVRHLWVVVLLCFQLLTAALKMHIFIIAKMRVEMWIGAIIIKK